MNDYFVYRDQDSQYGYVSRSFYKGHEYLMDNVLIIRGSLSEKKARDLCQVLNSRNSPETD